MIPIIFGALAIGSAVFGAAQALNGMSDSDAADNLNQEAKECYVNAIMAHNQLVEDIEREKQEYQQFISLVESDITDISDYLKSNTDIESYIRDFQIIDRISPISPEEIKTYHQQGVSLEDFFNSQSLRYTLEFVDRAKDCAQIMQGGTTASLSLLAQGVGVASTGAPIAALSGAAANSATLAWLGGGSLASGGGGMALGAIISQGMFVGSSFGFIGSIIASHGANKLANAHKKVEKVDLFIDEVNEKIHQYNIWIELVEEKKQTIIELTNLAIDRTQKLDSILVSRPFSRRNDGKLVQSIIQIVQTLVDFIQAPIE
jgi:hypothetical protein